MSPMAPTATGLLLFGASVVLEGCATSLMSKASCLAGIGATFDGAGLKERCLCADIAGKPVP